MNRSACGHSRETKAAGPFADEAEAMTGRNRLREGVDLLVRTSLSMYVASR